MNTHYTIERDIADQPLILRDCCNEHGGRSVTNAAEDIVQELRASGRLPQGRRLLYFDSEGSLTEILLSGRGLVIGFDSAPLKT